MCSIVMEIRAPFKERCEEGSENWTENWAQAFHESFWVRGCKAPGTCEEWPGQRLAGDGGNRVKPVGYNCEIAAFMEHEWDASRQL